MWSLLFVQVGSCWMLWWILKAFVVGGQHCVLKAYSLLIINPTCWMLWIQMPLGCGICLQGCQVMFINPAPQLTFLPILMSISLFFPHSVGFRWPYWRKGGFRAPWPYWIARPNGTQWCPSSKQIVVIVEKTWHDFEMHCISSCQFDFFWMDGRIQYFLSFCFFIISSGSERWTWGERR